MEKFHFKSNVTEILVIIQNDSKDEISEKAHKEFFKEIREKKHKQHAGGLITVV